MFYPRLTTQTASLQNYILLNLVFTEFVVFINTYLQRVAVDY